jgi:YHS domain-containing protein
MFPECHEMRESLGRSAETVDRPAGQLASKRGAFVLAIALTAALISLACEQRPDSAAATPQAENTAPATEQAAPSKASGGTLTVVAERDQVCMVNDQFMGKPQIPVSVEGKTYYGCCPMCKERLAKNAEIRKAIDPVSRKSVDKADAVMGKTASGDILYFETHTNLAAYSNSKSP